MSSLLLVYLYSLVINTRAIAQSAAVDRCADVDLSARFGPVRHQYDTDWCASMVAADVLSYRLGVRVSGLSVGSNYYVGRAAAEARVLDALLAIPAAEYGGAVMSSLLTRNLAGRVCPASQMPDDLLGLAKWDVFDAIRAARDGRAAAPTCRDPIDLSYLRWRVVGRDWWPRPNLNALHEQLRRRNPVIATVEMNALFGLDGEVLTGAGTFGNHFVVVAGRKRFDGVCHLLVRNSWGESCAPYLSPAIRDCDRGHMWIEESHFRQALKNVTYLE